MPDEKPGAMHDGYLFTLGICGTASANSPALEVLGTMLAALPPVKRAAMLGDVIFLDKNSEMYDPLLDQIVQDMKDAELLLIVTPCYGKFLPGGLRALLEYAEPLAQSGILRGKVALLIWAGQCANSHTIVMLEGFCLRAGIEIAGKFVIQNTRVSDVAHLQEIAHHAYLQARSRLPHTQP